MFGAIFYFILKIAWYLIYHIYYHSFVQKWQIYSVVKMGGGHALKIANSQTHNTVLFMPRPVVCVCVLFTIQLCGYLWVAWYASVVFQ